jgi:hypothetical protein
MDLLESTLDRLADLLRNSHADEVAGNPRAFLRKVQIGLRERFGPRRGRKPCPDLDRAERLLDQGLPIEQICRAISPAYPKWNVWHQKTYRHQLRDSLRKRKKKAANSGGGKQKE